MTTEDLNPRVTSGVEETQTAEEAYEAFTRERYGRIIATIQIIVRDRATAEDLAQETFARAYLSWAKLWPDGNPGGWVHRVATNLALSWRRRAGREVRAFQRLVRRTEHTTSMPEINPELDRAVAKLPPRQRAAVALHYVLGLSMDQCAEALGCAEGTVKSLLFRARGALRDELGEDFR